jgi:DNA-binding response OmpR family regulator
MTTESELIEAARKFAYEVSSKRLRRITLTLDDNTRRTITIRHASGWSFGANSVTFNEVTVALRGKALATLKRLVEDEIVADSELLASVWNGEGDTHTLNVTISELRRVLKTELKIEGNPIQRVEGGYRFTG